MNRWLHLAKKFLRFQNSTYRTNTRLAVDLPENNGTLVTNEVWKTGPIHIKSYEVNDSKYARKFSNFNRPDIWHLLMTFCFEFRRNRLLFGRVLKENILIILVRQIIVWNFSTKKNRGLDKIVNGSVFNVEPFPKQSHRRM